MIIHAWHLNGRRDSIYPTSPRQLIATHNSKCQQVEGIDSYAVWDFGTLADNTYQSPLTVMIIQPPAGQSSLQKKVRVSGQYNIGGVISSM